MMSVDVDVDEGLDKAVDFGILDFINLARIASSSSSWFRLYHQTNYLLVLFVNLFLFDYYWFCFKFFNFLQLIFYFSGTVKIFEPTWHAGYKWTATNRQCLSCSTTSTTPQSLSSNIPATLTESSGLQSTITCSECFITHWFISHTKS